MRQGRPTGVVLAALLGVAPACGKKGDPLPPLRPTPGAVTGLRVAQRGAELEIGFTAPRASTDGARLPVLEVEILVAEGEGDISKVGRARRLKVAPGETLTERQPLPAPGTNLRVAARALAKGHQGRPGDLVRLTVVAPLSPPRNFTAELKGDGVLLEWEGEVPAPLPTPTPTPTPTSAPSSTPSDPASPGQAPAATGSPAPDPSAPAPSGQQAREGPPSPPVEGPPTESGPQDLAEGPAPTPTPTPEPFNPGFFIYRRTSDAGFAGPLLEAALTARVFLDTSARPGDSLCYEARAVASADPLVESAGSNEACVDVKDILPPASPTGVTVLVRDDGVEISWSSSPEADLLAYRVYRLRRAGERERLAQIVAPETAFVDRAPEGRTLRYVVTAVDRAGNEGPPSAPALVQRPE